LKKPKKINETPIGKKVNDQKEKVIALMPKCRFKYKSVIKSGALKRIVSRVI